MFANVFDNKKVLVTGNTGFKGSWLTVWLLKLGAHVYGISKGIPTRPSMFESLQLHNKIVYYEEDVRNLKHIAEIITEVQPDFLFHLAAQSIVALSYRDPIETLSSNVMGTAHILEALRISNAPCVAVIITSDKCYDNIEWVWGYKETDTLGGKDLYSGSKGAAELIVKSYVHSFFTTSVIKLATGRAGNVIGGGDWAANRIVPDCMKAWSQQKLVEIRHPHATRPWQHVLEPLSGYLTLAAALKQHANLNGESFNFGPASEQEVTVQTLIEDLSLDWRWENHHRPYTINECSGFHEAGVLKLNCDKARYHLKWRTTLEYKDMLGLVSQWYHAFYQAEEDMYAYTVQQIEAYEMAARSMGLQWAR